MSRSEFSSSIRNTLAGRAGYQCSHPDCDIITIGPGDAAEEVSSIGEAAHIYSASLNGPRGQANLTDAELKSISNGFWACKNHARLIDVNDGNGFSAEQLQSWKLLHEEQIKRKQGRLSKNVFWLNSFTVIDSNIFEKSQTIHLGKVTFLHGARNSCGKSTLLNWISCFSNYDALSGWLGTSTNIEFLIEFYSPKKNKFRVKIEKGQLKSTFNDVPTLFNPISTTVHKVSDIEIDLKNSGLDDEKYLCYFFSIDKVVLKEILNKLGSSSYSFIEFAEIKYQMPIMNEDQPELKGGEFVQIKLNKHDNSCSLRSLSTSEIFSVIFEIALEKIKALSQHMPCILLVDANAEREVYEIKMRYFDYLTSSDANFQTIITSMHGWDFNVLGEATIYCLEASDDKTKIIPYKA